MPADLTRAEFEEAYREARVNLRTFTATRGSSATDFVHRPGDRRAAEDRWAVAWRTAKWPAYRACVDRMSPPEGKATLSNGALYAYRHGFYYTHSTSWQGWVKQALAVKVAA
jgi:hypothetical protein